MVMPPNNRNVVRTSLGKVPWLILCIIVLLIVKRLARRDKFYLWDFTYERHDLKDIVHSIEQNGRSTLSPVNKISEQLKTIKDPSHVFCKNSKCDKIELLFVVKSFVANFGQRMAIRKTWGKSQNTKIKTIFVTSYIAEFQDMLDVEALTYNDLLQFDFNDEYDNLVYKTMFTLLWYDKQNINATYVHFLDDDRFVNSKNIYQFASDNLQETDMKMFGYKVNFGTPFRGSSSKWSVSLQDYPYDFWPPYLIGGTLLTNTLVVQKLAKAIPYVKIIKIEDALIGIMCKLLNIQLIHNSGFKPYFEDGTQLKDQLSSPDYKSYSAQMDGWSALHL